MRQYSMGGLEVVIVGLLQMHWPLRRQNTLFAAWLEEPSFYCGIQQPLVSSVGYKSYSDSRIIFIDLVLCAPFPTD